ncbi:rod shape-determining protein MreC [bacterium]|nr:rod shape-determining protein MreC [bacterium]
MSVLFGQYWKKVKDRCFLIAAIVFSILLMVSDQTPLVLSIKNQTARLMRAVHDGVSWLPRSLIIGRENQRLMMGVGRLAMQLYQVQEVMVENERLRKLLDFKERNEYDLISARIVSMETTGTLESVYLDVGVENGCEKNMVLMTYRGVVGRLVSVGRSTSIGQMMTDPNFRISARLQRSRVLGIVRWLYGNVCVLEGVHQRADVQIGDWVVTSGYSDIYPPGLPIGRIYWISHEEENLFQEIRLWLDVDFYALEEVFVLKKIPD